ncbi:MAG: winged helix-turn-helix transcriptional regulator [Candidatus Hermodarchaeota archaeon]|nr:winged helix-turn-helix transcriptional regulator [Candidatus Hermodarchaeota archaeon]
MDKGILVELYANCRATYRGLAKKQGLTATSVKKRITQLREVGFLSRPYVLLSLAMQDADYCLADLTTDGTEQDETYIDLIGMHPSVKVVVRKNPSQVAVLGEVVGPLGMFELGRFLRGLPFVEEVSISFIYPVTPSPLPSGSQYSYRGNKVTFTTPQLQVLRCLLEDARKPANEIANQVNLSARRVRQVLQELQRGGGLYFTIFTKMSAGGLIPFTLNIDYDETKATPYEVTKWVMEQSPFEYWNTFLYANRPALWHFCTAKNLLAIEAITNKTKKAKFAKRVGAEIVRPQTFFVGPGHMRLAELVGLQVANHRVEY